jgi:hypothetical protein
MASTSPRNVPGLRDLEMGVSDLEEGRNWLLEELSFVLPKAKVVVKTLAAKVVFVPLALLRYQPFSVEIDN